MRRESARAVYIGVIGSVLFACASSAPAALMGFTDAEAFQDIATDLVKEDFESDPWLPPGPLIQPVLSLGVTWTSPEMLRTDTVAPFQGARSLFAADQAGDPLDEITAEFGEMQSAVGAYVGNAGNQNAVELLAFGVSGELIGSAMLDLSGASLGEYAFLGVATTGEQIGRVVFRSVGGINDEFILDDFVFGVSQLVPEPTAVGVLMLAGLAGRRRRRA